MTFEMEMVHDMVKILSTEMMYELMITELKDILNNRNHEGDWMTEGN